MSGVARAQADRRSFLSNPVFARTSPELAALVAAHDWGGTPLGPVAGWSPALRSTVEHVLSSGFGLLLWWGPHYIQIYNDAYRPVLGNKHPRALGQPVAECWSEVLDVIGPLIERPFREGTPSVSDDLAVVVNRFGRVEEAHFTVAYSPVVDHTVPSSIGGVLATVCETTATVINERRIALLSELGTALLEQRTPTDVCRAAAAVLGSDPLDIPFALAYLLDDDGTSATLAGACGVPPESSLAPAVLTGAPSEPWALTSLANDTPTIVANLAQHHRLPQTTWKVPASDAAIVPIRSMSDRPWGFLAIGLSPMLQRDRGYLEFLTLLAAPVATAIANVHAYEAERKRAEALAELDRAKIDFFSNVSHEFRTPLTLMLGPLAELAKSSSPEQFTLVDAAQRNSLRLLKLVNTLLDFSRIEAGRMEAAFVETDVAGMTADLASTFRATVESLGLQLVVDTAPVADVYVDRGMWEKIVLNLLSNAVKFTLEGEIRVELRGDESAAVLTVADSGVGVPAEELPRIFERFHGVRGTQARTHEGSGIGLALVSELVQMHGGSIEATSEAGRGSTFRVRIPRGTAHLDPDAVVRTAISPHISNVRPYIADLDATIARPVVHNVQRSIREGHVLVVDDNQDLRSYVAHILGTVFEVATASNGLEALAALRDQRIDVIVSDVMMPGIDGYELLRRVRSDPATADTRFIMLSAQAGEEAAVHGLGAGADDYIVKPFSAEQLVARVRAQVRTTQPRSHHRPVPDERRWFERPGDATTSEAAFRVFADQLPVMLYQQDVDGGLSFTNRVWHNALGLPRDPSSHTLEAWKRVMHPEDVERFLAVVSEAIEQRRAYGIEFRLRRADADLATARWHVARAVPHYDVTGEFRGWNGSIIDIQDQREALERSQLIAEALQRAFLPSTLPTSPHFRLDAVYQPAEADAQVGGDWFDALQLPDGRFLLSIGDVTGHGIAASAVAARLRHALSDFGTHESEPARVLQRANEILRLQHPGVYATALLAYVEADATRVRFASAGHPPPIVADRADRLGGRTFETGIALGVVDQPAPPTHEVAVTPDLVVAFYTDGLVEFGRDMATAEATLHRAVRALVGDTRTPSPAIALREAVLDGATPPDDLAILVLQFAPVRAAAPQNDPRAKTCRFHSAEPFAASAARHELMAFVRTFLSDDEALFATELIVGELLANTVEHAAGPVDVTIDTTEGCPRLTVCDAGPGCAPVQPVRPRAEADKGRGLFLVTELVGNVEIAARNSGGTCVSVALPWTDASGRSERRSRASR